MKTVNALFLITLLLTMLSIAACALAGQPHGRRGQNVSAVRTEAIRVLRSAMAGSPFDAMHAAEALLWNGFPGGVTALYREAAASSDPKARACGWRVLAQDGALTPDERGAYLRKVRAYTLQQITALQSPAQPGNNADFALESLAKLGYAGRDAEIVAQARGGTPVMQVLARWVLANSGKAADEAYLARLLDLSDERMRGVAAYALRYMKRLRPATIGHLERRLAAEPADAPDRFFYVIALYVQGPEPERSARKAQLYWYADHGGEEAQWQSLLRIGQRGDESDLQKLAPYLASHDKEVRIAAANAILTVLGRLHELHD